MPQLYLAAPFAWISLLALLVCVQSAAGVVFRHTVADSHGTSAATISSNVDERHAVKSEQVHLLSGLLDVTKDLEADKKKDDSTVQELESQIVALVKKRDAAKRDDARKVRELAFLHMQIDRARSGLGTSDTAAAEEGVAAESEQGQDSKADTSVDAAIASADQVVKQAEAAETAVQRSEEKVEEKVGDGVQQTQAVIAQAAAQSTAEAVAQREAKIRAEAEAAAEAKLRAEAEEQKKRADAEAAAEARLRAEAEEKAKQKIAAEEAAKRQAEAAVRAEEEAKRKAQEAEQKKKDALADSADDSFKNFMKEEDGEDQMGDSDYEDSANALAGAIGWNRKEIEKKADDSVKQLTEAIGGKKVVQSLQGMMSGLPR
jgi:hypothetical protein